MKPLRLAFLADAESVHTQRWLGYFARRGHEVHLISFYPTASPPLAGPGVQAHSLCPPLSALPSASVGDTALSAPGGVLGRWTRAAYHSLPLPALLLATWLRYRRHGLGPMVAALAPQVLHGHYLTAYGFYGTAAHYRPYAVSAWGSDVLRQAATSPFGRAIARYTLRRADLVTADSDHVIAKLGELGGSSDRTAKVVLGVEEAFLDASRLSVNRSDAAPSLVVSLRSLERPLYNVDVIIRAMVLVRRAVPQAELIVAGEGRLRPRLETLAADLGLAQAVRFLGQLPHAELPSLLARAALFVSVPSSDATPASLLEAMAVGCFPVVSDLPSLAEWVEDDDNGFRVRPGDATTLAERIVAALTDAGLRRRAAERNLAIVQERALFERNMATMEDWYYRLAAGA